ncbi:probable disease resistance protein At4g27220 [Gastrolobium bilobum]|uniref:probable disease resistance protein At4g27220 n=1 Tax=Gastrolobium bilobum TaxID=150636 RepID=UPI002AB17C88|nr:probable disease resistance protein At4g27220 [Gastrolobium bilobum]
MDPLIAWFCQFMMSPRMKERLKQQMLIPLWKYEARVRELDIGVEDLKKKRAAVQHRVEEEENRYGRRITDEVKKWIEGVDKIISECEDFHGDERCKLALFDLFTSGYLPKLGIRYHLSTKAYDITRKINGLSQTAKHDTLSYWFGPPSMAAFFSIVGYESFPSRDEIKKKIMAALKNPNVRMIGLHGLSGVGKTSLAKKVAQEALKDKMFNVVVMANVTRNADIRKIQGQIADMLGMKLDEESDIARAARIQKRLKNERESTLIILDDLWDKLDFNMLGIPSENDDEGGLKNVKEEKPHGAHNTMKTETSSEKPKTEEAFNMMKSENILDATDVVKIEDTLSRYKGWKMLLISETKQVLSSQMEGRENSIFSVDVLMEKEAQALFKKKAGIGDTDSVFEKLAAQIANKCQGLPMSIVTTARALKNQSRSVWEDVNRKLEWQKLTGAPEFSTKLSYELLENEELKFTFLLCARMGPDALIMDLIKYCIGLGFLQGVYTVREARDRVYVLVGKLKESGLLSDSYSNDYFTMQEIVRSAASSIASKEEHVFTLTKGKVDEWPEEDKLKRYTAISLQHCDIIEGFPLRINCPRLRVFHVSNNGPHLKIPSHFFKGMKELKVLILTGFYLSPLPSSITCLTKLRMLCLEHCMLGVDLSIIGELKKLRVLSFSGSNIEILPTELKQLIKLQILDISNCSKLRVIPSNVIQYLISLEELYMRRTPIQWNNGGEISQSENASLSELRHLNQLTTLDIEISNVDHLSDNLFFDKLYSYKIVIGDLKAYLETDFKMPEKYEASRFLAVQLDNGFDIHSQNGVKLLFDRVENLLLEDLNGVQDIFYRLNLKGFPYLKHLSIVSNSDIQSLINPEKRKNNIEKAFPKLESLYLYNLKNMKKICSCELSTPSFGKLKVIKIYLCNQLENVFSISVVRLLIVLETLEISKCKSLKKIVPVQIPSANKIEGLEFPELRSLTLQSLPQFITIQPYSSTGETKELFHDKVCLTLS